MTVAELVSHWEARTAEFSRLGALVDAGKLAAQVVTDLKQLQLQLIDDDDDVTLSEASRLGGYSVDRLQRLVASGQIGNVGRKHRPRIRRRDIPVKPGYSLTRDADAVPLSERRRIAASVIEEQS
jgi:hypothetical protein